jgi:hypothetical protein
MGFLSCRVERSEGGIRLLADSARMRLDDGQARALEKSASDTVTVGIRPERLSLIDGSETNEAVVVSGTVDMVEMLVPREQHVKINQPVTFGCESRHLYLFNHETGARMG